jgi:hypothetical protein
MAAGQWQSLGNVGWHHTAASLCCSVTFQNSLAVPLNGTDLSLGRPRHHHRHKHDPSICIDAKSTT